MVVTAIVVVVAAAVLAVIVEMEQIIVGVVVHPGEVEVLVEYQEIAILLAHRGVVV
jgi:hypothetical protein